MAKIFYIEDANGEYFSADKTRRFKALQGKELRDYLNTPEGHAKRFLVEDDIGIEIPAEAQKDIRKYERRKQYISDIEKEHDYTVMSLYSDVLTDDDGTGEEVIPDEDSDVEDAAINNVMLENLRTALTYLTDDERWILDKLILSDTPMTDYKLSEITGIPRRTLSCRKRAAMSKLKKYLEN